jgi:hypothetical protein
MQLLYPIVLGISWANFLNSFLYYISPLETFRCLKSVRKRKTR